MSIQLTEESQSSNSVVPSAVSIAGSEQLVFPLRDITQEMERMIEQGYEHLLFCVNNSYLCNLLAGIVWELEVIREKWEHPLAHKGHNLLPAEGWLPTLLRGAHRLLQTSLPLP